MKYSIITINYNNRDGLRRTIESVVNQTCKDYEYIIIDGGSTDGSVDVIKEYADKIDFWVSEPDKGIYNAMNKGIDHAHGEYLNFMNSGDCFYAPMVLEEVKPLLTADIVSGKVINTESKEEKKPFRQEELSLFGFFYNTLPHQGVFIRRELNEKNRYDETLKIVADRKLFIQTLIFQDCSYRDIDTIVCKYEPGGISDTSSAIMDEIHMVFKQLVPPRILKDYYQYKSYESPLLPMIPQLKQNRMWRLHNWTCRLTSLSIKVYGKLLNIF